MANSTNNNYNNFSCGSIKTDQGNSSEAGWIDYLGNDTVGNTPIDAENLNAMLNMLIYIRNVIGKTDDFADTINSTPITKPATGYDKDADGTTIEEHSLATYLKDAFNAIIGTDKDTAKLDTIKGAKKYTDAEIYNLRSLILEGLDFIDCGTAEELIKNGGDN